MSTVCSTVFDLIGILEKFIKGIDFLLFGRTHNIGLSTIFLWIFIGFGQSVLESFIFRHFGEIIPHFPQLSAPHRGLFTVLKPILSLGLYTVIRYFRNFGFFGQFTIIFTGKFQREVPKLTWWLHTLFFSTYEVGS